MTSLVEGLFLCVFVYSLLFFLSLVVDSTSAVDFLKRFVSKMTSCALPGFIELCSVTCTAKQNVDMLVAFCISKYVVLGSCTDGTFSAAARRN